MDIKKLREIAERAEAEWRKTPNNVSVCIEFQHSLEPKQMLLLLDTIERYEAALLSISKNSCCDQCQEAKRVALTALRGGEGTSDDQC